MAYYDWFNQHVFNMLVGEIDEGTKEFFRKHEHLTPNLGELDDPELVNEDGDDIMDDTLCPWIPVPINVPVDDILPEAMMMLDTGNFTLHRPDANGWLSLAIHGLGSTMTGIPEDYGLEGDEEELSDWTDIAKYCPRTVEWMQDEVRYSKFARVRFMALLPGGWIEPHTDRDSPIGVGATNIAINNPDGCRMVMEDWGTFPFQPGTAFKINTGYKHSVWNESDEPRIHMIFDGSPSKIFKQKVKRGYQAMMKQYRD